MDKCVKVILDIKKQGKEEEYYGRKSLNNLMTFILGYTYKLWKSKNSELEFLPGFNEFVLKYYGIQDNINIFQNKIDIINFFSHSDEEALYKFYELLDMFLLIEGVKYE